MLAYVYVHPDTLNLKGKFNSGIEGTLASTLNHDFNWKQLLEMILCIFLLMFSKFIWVTLIQKQQKYKIKRDFEFWAWASHFIMIWNILPLDTSSEGLIVSRMPNMQGLCPYYLKDHMKAMLYWQTCHRCVVLSFKFELSVSILKQLIIKAIYMYFINFYYYFTLNQNMVVQ